MQRFKKAFKSFDEDAHPLVYCLIYSLIWLLMAGIVYHYFFDYDKSFIWNNDGWNQHFKALIYYRSYLRTIFHSIFVDHSFHWGNYSFAMGYGQGFYTVLHYYVIGDPFAFLYVLCPSNHYVMGYELLILLRIFLAGLSFSALCYSVRKDQNIGKLAASMTYCFGGFLMFAGIKHPYFVNPLIYLPLLVKGANRMLKQRSPLLFILMIFIACASNFYFFYIQVILLVIYVIAYCIFHRFTLKKVGSLLWQFIGSGLLGTLMGAFVLLPVLLAIMTDSGSRQVFFESLYSANYYNNILATFMSYFENGEWTVIGAGALSLVGVVYLFFDRHKLAHMLRGLLVLFTVFLLLPIFGLAMNAFQYVSNRWDFGYVLLISFILFYEWEAMTKKLHKLPLIMSLALLGAGSYYCYGMMHLDLPSDFANENAFYMMRTGIIFLLIMIIVIKPMLRKIVLVTFACTCIGMNSFYAFSKDKMDVLKSYYSSVQAGSTMKENEATELAKLDSGQSFYRYSGMIPYENLGLNAGVSSTSYDWSLVNMNINDFYDHQGVTASMIHHFKTLNERTYLNALAAVKYYISTHDVPYGYRKVKHVRSRKNSGYPNYSYDIYKNKYALPLGYTYDSVISEKSYLKMDMASRNEAIMQGAVVKGQTDLPQTKVQSVHKNRKLRLKYDHQNIVFKKDCIIVKKPKAVLDFYYDGLKNSETYLSVKGFDYTDFDLYKPPLKREKVLPQRIVIDYLTYNHRKLLSNKEFYYYTKLYSRNSGRHDFMLNTGYSRNASNHISVVLPKEGVYHYRDVKIISQPMTHYKKYIRHLKKDVLTHVTYRHNNQAQTTYDVSGQISLNKKKLLCLSIPYEQGWRLYVDGQQTKLLKVNDMYMGVILRPGIHHLRLVYHTPGLKAGILTSVMAGAGLIVLIFYRRKNHLL